MITKSRLQKLAKQHGTPLFVIDHDALRQVYRLSYREIADKLAALKVETNETEVGEFCRLVLKPRGRKSRRRGIMPPGR